MPQRTDAYGLDDVAADLAAWDRELTRAEQWAPRLPPAELERLRACRDVWAEIAAGLTRKRAGER